jgi:hypothetical protein
MTLAQRLVAGFAVADVIIAQISVRPVASRDATLASPRPAPADDRRTAVGQLHRSTNHLARTRSMADMWFPAPPSGLATTTRGRA